MEQDRYEIIRLIGKGRTGGVYLAKDAQTGDDVAMRRFFFPQPADDSIWQNAFDATDTSDLKLTYPHILPITNAGSDEDGPYLITPYLENVNSLTKTIQRQETPSPAHFHNLASQLLTALAAVHETGRIHGAISPNSILISANNATPPTVHLTDWGLQQITENVAQQTEQENLLREPSLTAPEILKGGKASRRADIYSLSHTLFAFAARGHPYSGLTTEEVLIQINSGHTINPHDFSIPLPQEFKDWLLKAMHPDPKQRFQNASEALARLPGTPPNPSPNPKPPALASTTPSATATPSPKQNNRRSLLVGIAAILTCAAIIVTLAFNDKPQSPTPSSDTKSKSQSDPASLPATSSVQKASPPTPKPQIPKPSPEPQKPTAAAPKTPEPEEPTSDIPAPHEPTGPLTIEPLTPPSTAPPKPSIARPVTLGDFTFHPPIVHTKDFASIQKPKLNIPLDRPKVFAWLIVNSSSFDSAIRGAATPKLASMIQIATTENFSLQKIESPRATYTIKDQQSLPEALLAHGRHSKIKPGQGYRITLKIPNLGPDPLNVTIDTQATIADIQYRVTPADKSQPKITYIHPLPPAAGKAMAKGPIHGSYHSQQTITINQPKPNSTVIIDVLIDQTYFKNTSMADTYSLGLNAVTIWRP